MFMEPYSQLVHGGTPVATTVPAFMYGTRLAEEGVVRCNVPGYDYMAYYKVWKCPRIALRAVVS